MGGLNDLIIKEEGKRMDIMHLSTGEPLTYGEKKQFIMHLMVGSADSATYKKSIRKITDRRISEQARSRKAKITALQIEEEAMSALADVIYDGSVSDDGITEVKVTPGKSAIALFKKHPFIYEQASEFMGDRVNFLPS